MTQCIWCFAEVDGRDSKPLCAQCRAAIQRHRSGPSWSHRLPRDPRNAQELELRRALGGATSAQAPDGGAAAVSHAL
jgi:hypothetical protein